MASTTICWNIYPRTHCKILKKDILNKICICGDFPHQGRAASVIPIPKPNKDHTDPLSYRPIALTSCLCKMLECMINTQVIWCFEKLRILDKSQCGFRKHLSTTDHLVSLARYLHDAFALRQQAIGLFFDLKKANETTWQYGIIWDLYRIGLRGRLHFVSEYLRDWRIRVRIGTTLSDEFYPEEGVPTGGVLAVTCFGLKINELLPCIARDIFRALFVDDLAICFYGRSLKTIERHLQQAVNAIQEWATRNYFRFAAHKCIVLYFTASRSRNQKPPTVRVSNTLLPVEESTKLLGLWWNSHILFKKHISVLKTQFKDAPNLMRVVAHLKWGGDRYCTGPLFTPSWTTVAICVAQQQTLIYDNWTASITRDWDWHWEHFAPAQCPAWTQEANEAPPVEERRLQLSMHYYMRTRACINNPAHHFLQEFGQDIIYLYAPKQNGRGGMTQSQAAPVCLKVKEAMISAEIDADQETWPHWRGKQIHDLQARSPS